MRVLVTKPANGTTNVRCDDRRGATGKLWKKKNVPLGELQATVGAMLGEWEALKAALDKARKPSIV